MLLAEQSGLSLINAAGKLPFTAVADLLRGAEIFVGTDTSTTHLAACVGAPTVALCGPTPPKTWGPWPVAWKKDEAPFQNIYGTQRAGNVSIVRHECRCQPFRRSCKLLDNGLSTCMLDLTPATVIAELEQRLGTNLSRKQKVI